MHNLDIYHKTVVEMESAGVDAEYLQGWQGGFLVNPKREEQRVNEAYEAGYEDGANGVTDGYKKWSK
ncbi:MAG: hypothetical protein OEZ39_10575 [Gammaproteobacteria bacterium]|nr:hypothetical protein [Gammaproteobacteria bacterium]MDH5652287.1 hypothetical protein [Gammaproteobacteria bacterium]